MSVPQTEVLVFVDGQEIARHVLGPGAHTFGSSETWSIRIDAALVSRQHARLTVGEDGSLLLEDLASTNGAFLDGQRITAPTPVAPNQSIQIGAATLLIQQRATGNGSADGMPPELSQVIRYEPGAEIKRGGMGAILAARQAAIRREVALKVMLRNVSAHDRLRFIEEAQITGQLEHPNIVPVHDLALNEHGQPYYTMKLVKGHTLKEILKLLSQGDTEAIAKYPPSPPCSPSSRKSATPWPSPTPGASSTATSSSPTSWSANTAKSSSWTGASRRSSEGRAPARP